MEYQEYCDLIAEHYRPRHRHLYILREEMFVPDLAQAVRAGTPEALRQLCREVHPQVYTFDMLRPRFCAELLEEAACFEQWCAQTELPLLRPNTMNNYGTVLDSFGFAPALQQLMAEYVLPFSALFYPDVGGDSLDSHHGFIVEYAHRQGHGARLPCRCQRCDAQRLPGQAVHRRHAVLPRRALRPAPADGLALA